MDKERLAISFCVVCMNRLHHLRQTLERNILDNRGYHNLEFVLLDYNSQDGLEHWVKHNFTEYIASGKLRYYKTPDPLTFNHSHSKNIAFKLAKGDIVCNINADHYTGVGFADYVNACFSERKDIVLTTIDYFSIKKNYSPPKDTFGKVCVSKKEFLNVGGFDERMDRYGFEDWDFINRLELAGLKREFIEDKSFLQFVPHHNNERYSLRLVYDNLSAIYIDYQQPAKSGLLVLYKDGTFNKGTMMDNSVMGSDNYVSAYTPKQSRFINSLMEKEWIRGTWKTSSSEKGIDFIEEVGTSYQLLFKNGKEVLIGPHIRYYLLTHKESIEAVINFNYFYFNRSIMESNFERKIITVNSRNFGKARIFIGFASQVINI